RQVDHRDTIDGSRRQDIAHRAAARRTGHDSAHRHALCRHRVRIRKPQGPVLDRARPCADRPRTSAVPRRVDRCRQEAQPHLRAERGTAGSLYRNMEHITSDLGRYEMKPARRNFLKAMGSSAASVVTSSIALAEESKSQPAGESHFAEKPAPIISGQSQAEGIAKFASRVTYDDLTPERRERLKISILDSLACAINVVGAPPIAACLAQAKEFG